MDNSQFLEGLATECQNRNITPKDLVAYIIEAKEGFKITRRGLGKAAALLGVGALAATGTASASTAQGIVECNIVKTESLQTDTIEIADLSSDVLDLQTTARMVLPLYAGTNPSTVVGDFYYDTTSD